MRRATHISAALLFVTGVVEAQFEPDLCLSWSGLPHLEVVALEMRPDQLLQERQRFQPRQSTDRRLFQRIFVEPRTGEIWAVYDGGAPTEGVARLEFGGGQYWVAEEIPLNYMSSFAGVAFVEEGYLVIAGRSTRIVTVDLVQRRIVGETFASDFYALSSYVPARNGRPAFACGPERVSWHAALASLDASQRVTRWYAVQGSQQLGTFSQDIVTTDGGRTFFSGGGFPQDTMLGLWEYDPVGDRFVKREDLSPVVQTLGILVDESRDLLYLGYINSAQGTRYSWGVYDLATNRIVRRFIDPNWPNWRSGAGWFPRDRLLVSPSSRSPGETFAATVSVGGDPGEVALLWFDRAKLGGVPVTGLSTPVAAGVIDAQGLFRTVLPYQPGILPLQSGDVLWFDGFSWDGNDLVRTGAEALSWR